MGWQDGSVDKNWLLCPGLGSNPSTHTGSSQPSETSVPGDLMPFSTLLRPCTHVVHGHACRQNTHTHKLLKYVFPDPQAELPSSVSDVSLSADLCSGVSSTLLEVSSLSIYHLWQSSIAPDTAKHPWGASRERGIPSSSAEN